MQNPDQLKTFRPKTRFDVKKRLWSGILVAIVSLLLASCTTTTNNDKPPTVTPPENDEAFASALVALINDARSEARTCQNTSPDGPTDTDYAATHPLTPDDRLEQAALKHSRDMAENGFFAHQSPTDDTTIDERLEVAGYGWTNRGETLARGTDASDPSAAVSGWLASDKRHCDVLMESRFTEIGIGIVTNQSGDPYLTAVFAKP